MLNSVSQFGVDAVVNAARRAKQARTRFYKDPVENQGSEFEFEGAGVNQSMRESILEMKKILLNSKQMDTEISGFAEQVFTKMERLDLRDIFNQIDLSEYYKHYGLEPVSGDDIYNNLATFVSKEDLSQNRFSKEGAMSHLNLVLEKVLELEDFVSSDSQKVVKREFISQFCYSAFDDSKVPEQDTAAIHSVIMVAILEKFFT